MAKTPAPAEQTAGDDLTKEALSRLQDARQQKSYSQADIEECYYFAAPRRVRTASSQSGTSAPNNDQNVLQTTVGFEAAEDFMTMILESFIPQTGNWAQQKLDLTVDKDTRARIERQLKDDDAVVFQMISASNLHAEMAKQGIPDGAIGVFAVNIEGMGRGRPARCIGVPIRELEFNIGPDGRVDDRFIVRPTKYRHLKAQLRGIEIPAKWTEKGRQDPNKECRITWGWWRIWDRDENEVWQHVVMIDDEKIHDAVLSGEGSCQLVIGRFGATPDFAWPDGPMMKALPDLRQHDDMRAGFVENIDHTLRQAFTFPDDGILNFEDGIESGMGYPRRAGNGQDLPEPIFKPTPLDSSHFEEANLIRRIKRLHYVDFPEQIGKTPPTASQWLDEMVEAQKKIGTPGYAFWREFPHDVFLRFRYLAIAAGLVKEKPGVRLQVDNPAQQAAQNQKVLTTMRFSQYLVATFPQTASVIVDDLATAKNVQKEMGETLLVLRDPADIAGRVQQISQLQGVQIPRLPGGLTGAQ